MLINPSLITACAAKVVIGIDKVKLVNANINVTKITLYIKVTQSEISQIAIPNLFSLAGGRAAGCGLREAGRRAAGGGLRVKGNTTVQAFNLATLRTPKNASVNGVFLAFRTHLFPFMVSVTFSLEPSA